MQLFDPGLPSVLDRWVQEDDLVLYPDLVDDGLEHKLAFCMLQQLH